MSGIVVMTPAQAAMAVFAAAMLIAMPIMAYAMKRANRPADTFGNRLAFRKFEPRSRLGSGGDGDDGGDGAGD